MDNKLWMYIPLIGQGAAYSIYASALWPSVQMVVKPHEVGTAYGVVTAIQNGGLALFPMIVGALKTACKTYAPWVEVFFSALAGVGVASGLILYVVDRKAAYRPGWPVGVLEAPGGKTAELSIQD